MNPVMDYHRDHNGKWMARCPYCKVWALFDTPGEAIRAGVNHTERCIQK